MQLFKGYYTRKMKRNHMPLKVKIIYLYQGLSSAFLGLLLFINGYTTGGNFSNYVMNMVRPFLYGSAVGCNLIMCSIWKEVCKFGRDPGKSQKHQCMWKLACFKEKLDTLTLAGLVMIVIDVFFSLLFNELGKVKIGDKNIFWMIVPMYFLLTQLAITVYFVLSAT